MKKIFEIGIAIILLLAGIAIIFAVEAEAASEPDDVEIMVLYPTDDAYISMLQQFENFGSDPALVVRNQFSTVKKPINWKNTLLKFDISEIPADKVIREVKLSLYYNKFDVNNPAGFDLEIYRIKEDWDEETVNFYNRPSKEYKPTYVTKIPSSPRVWMSWDVTEDVESFRNNEKENFGWMIQAKWYYGQHVPDAFFRSKEDVEFFPHLVIVIEDTTPPVSKCDLSGNMGDNNWYKSDVMVAIKATDDLSGVDSIFYKIRDGDWINENTNFVTFVVPENGHHTVEYYSVDKAGNIEDIKDISFQIDQKSPLTDFRTKYVESGPGQLAGYVVVYLYGNDKHSGLNKTFFNLDLADEFSIYTEELEFTSPACMF